MSPSVSTTSPPPHGRIEVRRTAIIPASQEEVWARLATPAGIDDELRPWLSMTMPRELGAEMITADLVGRPLGRAWLRLGGMLPVEYDDLFLVEVDAPHRFHERSSMRLARLWEHRRELEADGPDRTRLTDSLTLEARLPLPRPVLRAVIGALFTHRQRRLRRHFAQ